MNTKLDLLGFHGRRAALAASLSLSFLSAPPVPAAEEAAALSSVARLPVKEVTVFKDGHAFVLQEGKMAVDPAGNVTLDYLPQPVIGTFWAYAADPVAKLASVVAGQRKLRIERTALTLRELLEANVDAAVSITETNGTRYSATVLGFPTRTTEELARTSPPNSEPRLPLKANLVLLRTAEGAKAVPLERIADVTFPKDFKPAVADEEFRNLLTLKLDWGRQKPAKNAAVGLVYLQKGVRWIPSYKVDLDGKGNATIKLQATLLNELTDLEDVNVNLVVGVPTFNFKDTTDPIALQQAAARLSSYFQSDPGRAGQSALASQFSNTIMTQAARMGDYRQSAEPAEAGAGPGMPDATKTEDLFVFSLKHITLKRGARLVASLVEFTVPYKDLYVVDLPFAPPGEVLRSFNNQQQAELARLLNAPKAMHKVRLANKSPYPFTTAPALILREGRIVAQGMMTYASPGSSADLSLTTAVDIQVNKTDQELKRTPNAFQHNGHNFMRVDLAGEIRLANHRSQPVDLEVVRYALGTVDSADNDGKVITSNVFEATEYLPAGAPEYPTWWHWYGWPWWWNYVNGVGRVTWKLTLEPGKSVELKYAWHYFWL